MTTPKTVTIKKAKRSTFIQNKRHLTTHRIGDINVVDWRWTLPSDVFRYKCSHSIKADALLAPAFARMKVYTDLFWVSLKSIMPDFYEKIPNFDMQQKTSIKNGETKISVPYYFPQENIKYIQTALLGGTRDYQTFQPKTSIQSNTVDTSTSGLLDLAGVSHSLSSVVNWFTSNNSHPFGLSPDDTNVWDIKHMYNVAQLCSQMGFPAVATRVRSAMGWQEEPANFDITNSAGNRNTIWLYDDYNDYYGTLSAYLQGTPLQPDYQNHVDIHFFKPTYNYMFSTLPFKAYQKVYNEWFLNSMTTDPVDIYPDIVTYLSDGDFGSIIYKIQGQASRSLVTNYVMNNRAQKYINSLFQIRQCWYSKDYFNTASDSTDLVAGQNIGSTVLDLRKANAIQRLLEKRALVGGNRIFDFIAQHWSFFPDNIELDRPLHLGSDTDYINIGEVLQTSESSSTSAQGDRAGTANAFSRGRGVLFNSPDYGILLCLSRIVPEIDYFSGMERKWRILNTSDWPLPELAQIGFQAIYNSEVSLKQYSTQPDNDNVWAYAPRYSEWKDCLNQVSCEMQTSRLYWHQSPEFKFKTPGFNSFFGRVGFGSFAFTTPPYATPQQGQPDINSYLNNIFAVTDNVTVNHFQAMYNIECTVNRALPSNDMPQL